MPGDWNLPTNSTLYLNVLQNLKDRDVDSGTLCLNEPSNKPVGMIRYVRVSNKFQEWDGASWNDKVLSIAGGGTGATSAAGIRSALSLGDMALQNSTAVAITGGSIAGNGSGLVSLNGSNIASGTVPTARLGSGSALSSTFLRGDQAWAAPVIYLDQIFALGGSAGVGVESIYYLFFGGTLTLPTIVGNSGKRVMLYNYDGAAWTVNAAIGEHIKDVSTTSFNFSFGAGSSITLVANGVGAFWMLF